MEQFQLDILNRLSDKGLPIEGLIVTDNATLAQILHEISSCSAVVACGGDYDRTYYKGGGYDRTRTGAMVGLDDALDTPEVLTILQKYNLT